MTASLGFADLSPNDLVRTSDVAARLGFPSLPSFHRSAAARRASGFPRPQRRGLWRAGDLIAWFERGGFNQCAAAAARGAAAPVAQAANDVDTFAAPRAIVAARLAKAAGSR